MTDRFCDTMRHHRIDIGDVVIYTRFPDVVNEGHFALIKSADVIINKNTNEILKCCRWPLEVIFDDFLQIKEEDFSFSGDAQNLK